MKQYIKPILLGALISLSPNVVFAASQQQGHHQEETTKRYYPEAVKRFGVNIVNFGRAIGGNEEAARQLPDALRHIAGGIHDTALDLSEIYHSPHRKASGNTPIHHDSDSAILLSHTHGRATSNISNEEQRLQKAVLDSYETYVAPADKNDEFSPQPVEIFY